MGVGVATPFFGVRFLGIGCPPDRPSASGTVRLIQNSYQLPGFDGKTIKTKILMWEFELK
jgi:hypothetical protein